jgi:hypothetical protein
MILLLLGLFPARWRARYGDEFAALLDERPLGPFDVADILLGALEAQLHLRGLGSASPTRRGSTMSLHLGGYAAAVVALLWFLGLLFGSTNDATSETDTVLVPLALLAWVVGTGLLLVALVGLSAFQARAYPRMVWAAFAIPAAGALASLAGMGLFAGLGDRAVIGEYSGWHIWLAGTLTLIVGSGLFGLATWRTHTLSRMGAALLVIGALGTVPLLALLVTGTEQDLWVEFVVALLGFAAGWLVLGISALRAPRPQSISLEGASL